MAIYVEGRRVDDINVGDPAIMFLTEVPELRSQTVRSVEKSTDDVDPQAVIFFCRDEVLAAIDHLKLSEEIDALFAQAPLVPRVMPEHQMILDPESNAIMRSIRDTLLLWENS